jgi:hypothetical protein
VELPEAAEVELLLGSDLAGSWLWRGGSYFFF